MRNKEELQKVEIAGADRLRLNDAFGRGASRRDVMRMLIAAGMSAAAASTVATFAESAHAQAPRRGGKVKIASGSSSTTDTLDPPKGVSAIDYYRHGMFYNGLTRLDSTLTPQLELAEEIASSERAMVWNIKLRRDVRFHDGSPLTSADVVYSLQRHKDPALRSGVRTLAEQIEEITATGPHEVRIRLNRSQADMPSLLGFQSFFAIIKDGTTEFRTANGTGPYRCQEFRPGERSIAVRNNEYFKPGKPYLDEIELFGIPDESARVNALLSGGVHAVANVSPLSAQRVQAAQNVSLFETKGGAYHDLDIRPELTPGSSPDFVLAVKYLLNRQQILRTIYRGFGTIANDQPVDPTNPFFDPSLPQRPFDLDKARFHLQRSGLAGQTFPIVVTPGVPPSEDIALSLQQTARQIGLNFTLQRVPADGYWTNQWMKHPIGFGSTSPKPTADMMFSLNFHSRAPWNASGFRNDRFDQLCAEARGELDTDKRREMYGEMQRLVHDNSGACIPVFASYLDAHVSNLKGLQPNPLGSLMGFNFADSIWLDQ